MDEEQVCEECEAGAPGWLATFADLMALLMCFFVLLLSFSEIDLQKYKQVAGSMKFAFGVQKDIKVDDIPKGTSVIAQEFSPGRPDPTAIKVMQQKTTDNTKDNLDFVEDLYKKEVEELAELLTETLKQEIDEGLLEILIENSEVKVRIREKDSFPSGSAKLNKSFYPILDNIVGILDKTDGRIIVAGHSDNIPISTRYYPSNWVLSSARAASVVHYLAKVKLSDPTRIEIRAYADTQPIVPNDSAENRAKNRRVEIIVSYGNELEPVHEMYSEEGPETGTAEISWVNEVQR